MGPSHVIKINKNKNFYSILINFILFLLELAEQSPEQRYD
jgi:hypothetical protein